LISKDVQLLPLETDTGEPFYALNVQKIVDCIDYERSNVVRSETSRRPIKKINPLVLKQQPLVNATIFHLQDFTESGFFISDKIKQAIEEHNLAGLNFEPIQVSE
jgi:hypothetical protein